MLIPLAEKTDLIYALGSFALHDAVSKARSWERTAARASRLFVTVNLPLASSTTQPRVDDRGGLTASGLAPERLVLEITESVALDDMPGQWRYPRLTGSGWPSRSTTSDGFFALVLALLHPMIIKIHRSFVSPLHGSVYRHAARGDRLARPKAQDDRARRGDRNPRAT